MSTKYTDDELIRYGTGKKIYLYILKKIISTLKKKGLELIQNEITHFISKDGIVYSLQDYNILENGQIDFGLRKMKKQINNAGYEYVYIKTCGRKGKSLTIHRLVATAFIQNPNNYTDVNHKDHNKLNNNYNNLEWVSHKKNLQLYYDSLKYKQDINYKYNILKDIYEEYIQYKTQYWNIISKIDKNDRGKVEYVEKELKRITKLLNKLNKNT